MSRRRGDGLKARLFDRLLGERPNADPIELAREAGYTRPGQEVQRRKEQNERDRERAAKAAAETEQVPKGDRELALSALRASISLGSSDSTIVRASAELLRATPETKQGNGLPRSTVVVFQYASCAERPDKPCYQFDGVDADEVKEALSLASELKRRDRGAVLAGWAEAHAIDPGELAQLWAAYEHPSIRRAFLSTIAAHVATDPSIKTRLEKARETN